MAVRAPCTVGFAPHSGWAAAVIVGGTRRAPAVLARERIELAEAALPGCRQPYHALEALPLAQAAGTLRRSGPELTAAVTALGRGLGTPWGADQKAAMLLGWLLLA